jgi:hypothetical protein
MAKPAVEIKQEVVLELATLKLRRVSKRNCSSVKKTMITRTNPKMSKERQSDSTPLMKSNNYSKTRRQL